MDKIILYSIIHKIFLTFFKYRRQNINKFYNYIKNKRFNICAMYEIEIQSFIIHKNFKTG